MTVAPNLGQHLVPLTEGAALLLGADRGRRWADGSPLGFFEFLGTYFPPEYAHPMLSIHPEVTDAQNLLQQVLSAGQRGHSVAYLDLVRARVVRPITTTRCVREVDNEIPRVALGEGVDPAVIEKFWRPLRARLRVVDVAPTVPYPTDLDARRRSDAPSDRDLAQLATLLGVRAISWDLDLRDFGLAEPFDLEVAFAIGELASGKCTALVSFGLTAEATAALVRLARGCLQWAVRNPLLATGIVIGLAIVITRLRKSRELVAWLASTEWSSVLTQALQAAGQLMTAYRQMSLRMPEAPALSLALPTDWNLGRLLANAAGPLSAREIAAHFQRHGLAVSEKQVRDLLRAQPALFARNPRGQWQLGHGPT